VLDAEGRLVDALPASTGRKPSSGLDGPMEWPPMLIAGGAERSRICVNITRFIQQRSRRMGERLEK